MVEMQATNAKLEQRAGRMVAQLTGTQDDAAARLLAAAGGHVKLAVLLHRGLSPEAGRALLDEYGGDLRRALEAMPRTRD